MSAGARRDGARLSRAAARRGGRQRGAAKPSYLDDQLSQQGRSRLGGRPGATELTGCLSQASHPTESRADPEPARANKSVDCQGSHFWILFGPYSLCGLPRVRPSASGKAPPPTPELLQDRTSQQDIDHVTRRTSVELALHFLPKPSGRGDDGWTDENMAGLERDLLLAFVE